MLLTEEVTETECWVRGIGCWVFVGTKGLRAAVGAIVLGWSRHTVGEILKLLDVVYTILIHHRL